MAFAFGSDAILQDVMGKSGIANGIRISFEAILRDHLKEDTLVFDNQVEEDTVKSDIGKMLNEASGALDEIVKLGSSAKNELDFEGCEEAGFTQVVDQAHKAEQEVKCLIRDIQRVYDPTAGMGDSAPTASIVQPSQSEQRLVGKRGHDGTVKMKCPSCSKEFDKRGNLNRHILGCGKERTKECMCSGCGKSFTTDGNLKKHQCNQEQKEKMKCPKCDVPISTSEYNLKRHMEKCGVVFNCEKCGGACSTKNSLERHMSKCGDSPTTVFNCEKCGAACSTKYALERHMKRCGTDGKSEVLCIQCGKTFASEFNFKRHPCKQDKSEEFKCPICDLDLSSKWSLERHLKNHESDEMKTTVSCTYCDETFVSDFNMRRHRLGCGNSPSLCGEGLLKVNCTMCNVQCTNEFSLKRHMKTHHDNEITVTCPLCLDAFSNVYNMKRHKIKCTGKKKMCDADHNHHFIDSTFDSFEDANRWLIDMGFDDEYQIRWSRTKYMRLRCRRDGEYVPKKPTTTTCKGLKCGAHLTITGNMHKGRARIFGCISHDNHDNFDETAGSAKRIPIRKKLEIIGLLAAKIPIQTIYDEYCNIEPGKKIILKQDIYRLQYRFVKTRKKEFESLCDLFRDPEIRGFNIDGQWPKEDWPEDIQLKHYESPVHGIIRISEMGRRYFRENPKTLVVDGTHKTNRSDWILSTGHAYTCYQQGRPIFNVFSETENTESYYQGPIV